MAELLHATLSLEGWRWFGLGAARVLAAPFDRSVLNQFGSSSPARILGANEWWRLLTATFVHVSLLHLLTNMWCLWNLGVFGERLLGRAGLIAVYLLTGTTGMLVSLALSVFGHEWNMVAGASGAVFGLAGILIVMLSNRKLATPWAELRSLRLQVIFFAGVNLLLGFAPELLNALSPGYLPALHVDSQSIPRIDNSAHLGGFMCGVALGGWLFPRMTSGKSSYRARQALVFTCAALILVCRSGSPQPRVGQ